MDDGVPEFDENAVIRALGDRIQDHTVARAIWRSAARRVKVYTPVTSWEGARLVAEFMEAASELISQEVARPLHRDAVLNRARAEDQ